MDEMRIILIILGLMLLAAIYWKGRRDERRAQEKKLSQQKSSGVEPAIHFDDQAREAREDEEISRIPDYDHFFVSETDKELFFKSSPKQKAVSHAEHGSAYSSTATGGDEGVYLTSEEPAPRTMELPAGVDPLLIQLTVLAPQSGRFDPHFLKQTLDDSGMRHGDLNIYHYYRRPRSELEPNHGQRLFSIANLVEPGYFDPEDMGTYRTPGLALFLQLPGPIDGVLAFEKMHQMGEMLARRLSGILCDEKHNKLTQQSVTHIKDEIAEYNLRLRTKLLRTVH